MTLAEIIASVAIMCAVTAVVTPTVSGYLARNRAATVAGILDSVGVALNNNNIARGGIGFVNILTRAGRTAAYPQTLDPLVRVLKTTDVKCAGPASNKFVAADTLASKAGEPYSSIVITPGVGIATPIGVIRDSVLQGSGTTAGFAELHIDSVRTTDAANLDLAIDGTADSTAGRVRYSAATGNPTDLHFVKYLLPGYGC